MTILVRVLHWHEPACVIGSVGHSTFHTNAPNAAKTYGGDEKRKIVVAVVVVEMILSLGN